MEIDLTVLIEEYHLEVEVDLCNIMDKITDRIIEGDHKMIKEMTLGDEIIGRCKITEVTNTEVDVEIITDMYRDNYRGNYRNDYRNNNFGRMLCKAVWHYCSLYMKCLGANFLHMYV